MRVNFVAVNYNGASLTCDWLRSIRALVRDKEDVVQVVVVDNNSSPDDVDQIATFMSADENEKLVRSATNDGYFGGLNAGLAVLEHDVGSYTVVGNNDLTFSADFLQQLRYWVTDSGVMVLAPDVVTLDGRHQNPLARKALPWWHKVRSDVFFLNFHVMRLLQRIAVTTRRFAPRSPAQPWNVSEPEVVKLGIGACYVLTPAYFSQFERLDDRVFLWGEEVLLANQVESHGGSILFYPNLKVTHHESATVKTLVGRQKFEILRASYKIYRKYL